ncbi:uncharacterized protein si:ch211-91p5.3 isoform X2 [Hemibagrus wyckioides]|uniref:uncharacterized protein si:ch211-91p5.3 isoform X2 n=1 Tax=Hemibagrus wyckioides TaxID=337641 RepID=UPI00266CCDA1|nr:uncharacterized protein si:ch211-91p5.3 isoform X2 [Hemibagrus wyckioides]
MDYKRFSDENYKHWLQAAESLYILRSHIREFVGNETETFHKSLREKLKNVICTSKCSLLKCSPKQKQLPICDKCKPWKDAILQNHKHKGIDIPWNNCQPYLWPTDKWEVAKVYMIRGVKNHRSFDDFDISSILNFMYHCKHFEAFAEGQNLTKVINVRNKVMHSPDFTLKKEEMDECINNVQELANTFIKYAPGLKTISKQIKQFKCILERCSRQDSESTADSKKESLKLLDIEQHALKEKIEFLAQRYEENQGTELKEELQGMKNFLDQNKDLLENLGPQVNRLNEIQEKVNKHEEDINTLITQVDWLKKVAPDPMFTGEALMFKNHVFEMARKRKIPEPEFMEESEAGGYRGIVNVNGQTFRGTQVCNNKKNAHQEVAKIALDFMKSNPEWGEETAETTSSISSSTASSSNIYYGIVNVELNNQEVVSDGCDNEQEATESAYRKLACQFGLTSLEGHSFRTAVLEHFQRCNFPTPLELPVRQDDKFLCKLQLSGRFTFYDKDGSSKKKLAEHQAAKVALQYLSGILNCRSPTNAGDNWIGFLKESLDVLGLQKPDYDFTVNKVCISQEAEGATPSEDNSQISATKVDNKNDSLQERNTVTEVLDLPTAHTVKAVDCQKTETLDFSAPEMSSQAPKELDSSVSGTIYNSSVTVVLNNQRVVSDGYDHEQEAIESAYRKLACQFGLNSLESKTAVLEHFQRCNFPPPQEHTDCKDDKFFCKLLLTGRFMFYDKDGFSKKKQSEQQAAMIALKHLSGLFNYSFEAEPGKNYKGILQEQLQALYLQNPVYKYRIQESEDLERPSISSDYLHSSCTTPSIKKFCPQPNNSFSQECLVTETQDAGPLDKPNKPPNMDNTAIDRLLALFNLKPPSVNVESISTEMVFTGQVDIQLEKFTFQNNNDYTNKKDAFRKTYLLLGNALGISKTQLDENNAAKLVKQHFSQNNLTHPKEVFQNKCSLNDITYNLFYNGEGSTEVDAKQDALQKALDTLTLLFGFNSLPKCSRVEETEVQINSLLKTKGQKDVIYSPQHNLYKMSVELLFKDYTMESKQEKKKKENANNLSRRILGLLAVKPDPNTLSLRNCLDEWFIQNEQKQPVFENTEEAHGSKVTFSVKVSCSNPNWEDSVKVAEEKLVDALRERLDCLTN